MRAEVHLLPGEIVEREDSRFTLLGQRTRLRGDRLAVGTQHGTGTGEQGQ
jgi:hypothetical protein